MNTHLPLTVAVVCLYASLCSAQGPTVRVLNEDPIAQSNLLVRTGGMIQPPISGPSILFLNTQKRIPASTLQETFDRIQKLLHLPCVFLTKSATDPVADANKALADKKTAAVIVICDSPSQPALLVAPESRWVLVNVDALGGSDTQPDKLAERAHKELWRAFGYLMGAANSTYEHCLLKPVFSNADLDALSCSTISPEPFGKFMAQAKKLGIKIIRPTTYRKAVEEGWAPAPTNDIQRAIWDELKKPAAK